MVTGLGNTSVPVLRLLYLLVEQFPSSQWEEGSRQGNILTFSATLFPITTPSTKSGGGGGGAVEGSTRTTPFKGDYAGTMLSPVKVSVVADIPYGCAYSSFLQLGLINKVATGHCGVLLRDQKF